jgi:hypothetical protein
MLIDAAQLRQVQALPEFVKHSHVGQNPPIAQTCKRPPRSMLPEQVDQQIEGMCWREQCQQMDAKQLSRRKQGAPPRPGWLREERVDEIVWKVGREHL